MYFRNPSFIDDITNPEEKQRFAFDYDDESVRQRRDRLRDDIRVHQYAHCREYDCDYGGLDGEGKPHVTALEQFEKQVYDDLLQAVYAEFPPAPPPMTELAFERTYHTHFVEDRCRHFIGRHALLERMQRHIDHPVTVDSLPLVVVGEPGSGKTSLTCYFAKRCIDELYHRSFVLVHVVSASPASTDIREVLLRLCRELTEEFALEWQAENDDYQTIKDTFFHTLERAGEAAMADNRRVVLIIDAVNQLNGFYSAHSMDWFPPLLPAGVKAILSCTPDSVCYQSLQNRDPKPHFLEVPALLPNERKDIVVNQLQEYRKKLTSEQMELLLKKPDSHKPLFLLTVCEELRLQAQYGLMGTGVNDKIAELPGDIAALLDVVLDRVENDLAVWANTATGVSSVLAYATRVPELEMRMRGSSDESKIEELDQDSGTGAGEHDANPNKDSQASADEGENLPTADPINRTASQLDQRVTDAPLADPLRRSSSQPLPRVPPTGRRQSISEMLLAGRSRADSAASRDSVADHVGYVEAHGLVKTPTDATATLR